MEYLVSFIHLANVGWIAAFGRRGSSDHCPGVRGSGCVRGFCLPCPLLLEGPYIEDREGFSGLERHEAFTFLSPPFSEGSALFVPFSSCL